MFIWKAKHHEQCFKTWTGPVGRPGWRQKPAWELARGNPIDPGPGPPGQTRVRPGQFFFILPFIKRRRFGFLKGQNTTNWRLKKNEAISVTKLTVCKPNWNPVDHRGRLDKGAEDFLPLPLPLLFLRPPRPGLFHLLPLPVSIATTISFILFVSYHC